jgi:hypothetical protein
MIIEAVLIALIAAFFIGFEDGKFSATKTITHYGITAVITAIAVYIWMFLVTPAYVGIMGGYFRVLALPVLIVSIFYIFLSSSKSGNEFEVGVQGLKILAVLLVALYIIATPVLQNQQLYNIPNVTIHKNISDGDNFAPIDAQNMRLIDQDMAYYLGNKVIGSSDQSLGSQFQVNPSDFSIQNVNGKLYWVAPLEFRGFMKWWSAGYSPGYIMVDAEDPSKPAKLFTNYKMKYMTSSYFYDNIIRYVYLNGYTNVKLQDINFEVTDDLQPKWVVSLTKPSVVNSGDKLQGVLIVDPISGEINEYSEKDIPVWVDRVMPESTAMDYLTWYGSLTHGWINAVTTERDVNVISSNEMYLIHGNNGLAYWFAGLTSPSSSDQSLTGIALVNSRDGSVNIYKMSGWNEQAVVNAVDAAVSNFKNYKGCQPIPYDCSGRLAYVVSVAATTDTGKVYQELGIVDAITGRVCLGETKAKAFENYRRFMSQDGYELNISGSQQSGNITGIVDRISSIISSNDLGYRLIYLNNSVVIYEVPVSQFPEVALTNSGDNVHMEYADDNSSIVEVDEFDNTKIDMRSNQNLTNN